jgi:RNA polymerase sigma-70 factor (ECF subfamily)
LLLDKLEIFFEQTRERFFNFLLRLTGDADQAADVFQESYTRYWEHYADQEPSVRLLFTIGRNAATDGHRLRRRHLPFDEARQDQDQGPSQEKTLVIKESCRQVLRAMELLDPLERQVLALAVDGGLRYDAIAGITGISRGHVKVKIHRARQKLRRHLKEF